MIFKDRSDAGKQLIPRLSQYKEQEGVIVVGLARGGMAVAFEIASSLHLPLDVFVVRKIGAPGNEELALGAISEHGEGIFNEQLIGILGVSHDYLRKEIEKQKNLLKERLSLYRGTTPGIELKGKTILIVDDGIATGASMRIAVKSIRDACAEKIILVVPLAAPDSLIKIEQKVDQIICLSSPVFFVNVGAFYRMFDQISDEEVINLLEKSNAIYKK